MSGFEKPYLDDFCSKLLALGWEQKNSQADLFDYALIKETFKRKITQLNKAVFNDYNSEKILQEIITKLSSASENKVLTFLKQGMTILLTERNTQIPLNIKLIDYEKPENNEFNLIREQTFTKGVQSIRGDIVLFINGIPVVILEGKDPLKLSSKKQYIKALEQIKRYEYQVRDVFKYIQLGVGVAEQYPYIGTHPQSEIKDVQHYSFWKNNKEEDIFYLLDSKRLIEFIKYFVFFAKNKRGEQFKLVARYNQYYAVKKAVKRVSDYVDDKDVKNKGLVWHWQGSGKTYTMYFTANYYIDLYHKRNPLAFFVIDRLELETQFDTVLNSIDNPIFGDVKVIDSIEDMEKMINNIRESDSEWGLRIVMIHKFSPERLDLLKDVTKKECLFQVDEAHRSQYGDLGAAMRKIFKNGMFFGYTGTPVFRNERNTFKEFSYLDEKEAFLDVYFIADSEADGFTLPFSYRVIEEGKSEDGVKIVLNEEEIRTLVEDFASNYDDVEYGFDQDELKQEMHKKVASHITKVKIFLSNEKRIEKVVKYIADNMQSDTEDYAFKAMIVAVNRKACIKYKEAFHERFDGQDMSEVVMSYSDEQDAKIPEIMAYKEKLFRRYNTKNWQKINEQIVEDFQKKDKPQVLIVTDMLLTGFDAPQLKVMYLDKPIYYHRLLQAIARVNRPAPDKYRGLIVDSVGLLSHIKKTMSLYNHLAVENEDIKKDLMDNLLKDSKTEVQKLKETIETLKDTLKTDAFDIDIDEIISEIKNNTFNPDLLKQRIAHIALTYESNKNVAEIVQTLRRVIKQYKSLGAEPDKLTLLWDIKIVSVIYYTFIRSITRGRPSTKQVWDALVTWIHESTIVNDLLPKIDTELNPRSLTKVDIKKKGETGSYYFTLKNEVKKQIKNPLYVEIMKKLEHLRVEWMQRNLGIEEFLDELEKIDKEKEELDQIGNKEFGERIASFTKEYFKRKFDSKIDPTSLVEGLKNFETKARLLSKDKDEIKLLIAKLIIKELPREVRSAHTSKEIRKAEEEIKEYIVSEITESK